MAKSKEFKYVVTKVVGTVGKENEVHKTVEVGHFVVDGNAYEDKVYIVDHFFKRDGSIDTKANALCKLSEAQEIGKLLTKIK